MTPALPLTGGCYCGAIRYEVNALPLAVNICHCHDCQRLTGSAFSMPMFVPRSAFAVLQGATKSWQRTSDSGRKSLQHFCGKCGTRLYTEPSNPSIVNVRAGTLDDTSWLEPAVQVWTKSAQPWARHDSLLSYEAEPTDPTPVLKMYRDLQQRS
jgi:hypothetical protein